MTRKTAWLVAAGVAAVALGAAAVGAVALLVRGSGGRPSGEVFAGGGYLAIELEGDMPEGPAPVSTFFESRPPSIRALVEAVDRAARDRRVKGLLLRVKPLGTGWGRVQELRDALVRFRKQRQALVGSPRRRLQPRVLPRDGLLEDRRLAHVARSTSRDSRPR